MNKTYLPNNIDILIVEDSQTQAEKLKFLLENKKGYKVRVSSNGKHAIAQLEKQKPNLVISDIIMPEINGYTLCKYIKSNTKWVDIPVILVTSLVDSRDIIEGLECGADNFIRKPYDETYLLNRIDHILITQELRKTKNIDVGIALYVGNNQHFINAQRQQILDLLISTYEQAISVNEKLSVSESEVNDLNRKLKRRADELENSNQKIAVKNIELEYANQAKSRL